MDWELTSVSHGSQDDSHDSHDLLARPAWLAGSLARSLSRPDFYLHNPYIILSLWKKKYVTVLILMWKWWFPHLSLQWITSMCMWSFECQTGFKIAYAKPCLGKIATGDMALKQPQRKAEMATKLMTEDRLKLHSNKEKCKQNSKILTVTWFFPQYRKQ